MGQLGGRAVGVHVLDVVIAAVDAPLDEVGDPLEAVIVVLAALGVILGFGLGRDRYGHRRETCGEGSRDHVSEESLHGLLHCLE